MSNLAKIFDSVSPLGGDIVIVDGIKYTEDDVCIIRQDKLRLAQEVEFVVLVDPESAGVEYIEYYSPIGHLYCSFYCRKCYDTDNCCNHQLAKLLRNNISNLEESLINSNTPTISKVKRIMEIFTVHFNIINEEAKRICTKSALRD